MPLRAPRLSSRMPDGALSSPDQQYSSGNVSNGSALLVIGGDPGYTTHPVASHRPVQEEDCSKDGYAGPPPE